MSPPLPRLALTISEPESEGEVLLAGLPFTRQDISELLTRAKNEMELGRVKFFIWGEYGDSFTAQKFCAWLLVNEAKFQEDPTIVSAAAADLAELGSYLKRLGEQGNDVYYQFRPEVPFILSMNLDVS